MIRISVSLLISLLVLMHLSFSKKEITSNPYYTVTVNAGETTGTVSPNIMGFNIVYCFEGDTPWQSGSGKVPAMLKKIGAGQLRYPGGTVATFYHWQQPTGQGWADSWNPAFVATKNIPATSFMSIDEYLATVQKQHIEPLVGINMGSGMKYNRVEEGITEAVNLVKHCMAKGAKVKYYYLDNEPYQRDANFTFTAEQYADMVNRYVPRMKEVDPSIKIIVNTHPNTDMYTKTLLQKAGKNIDLVDVHMYWKFRNATFENWKKDALMAHRGINGYNEQRQLFKKVFTDAGYPDIELVILEWNIGPPGDGNTPPTEAQAALMVSEQFAQFVQSGLVMACFWPISWPGTTDWTSRALLKSRDGYKPNKMYDMFAQYTDILGQQKVASSASAGRLINVAVKSRDGKQLWVYLINKNEEKTAADVTVTLKGFAASAYTAKGFTSEDNEPGSLHLTTIKVSKKNKSDYTITVPQHSFVKISFKRS